MNRRDFITKSSKVVCACVVGVSSGVLSSCSDVIGPEIENTPGSGVTLDFDLTLEENNVLNENMGAIATNANEIDSKGLLLVNVENEIKAFSRRCTHQGGPMNSFSGGTASCAWHGAQFNTNGQHVSGPGEGTLKSYETQLSDNILTVFGS